MKRTFLNLMCAASLMATTQPAYPQVRPQPAVKLSPVIQARLTKTSNTKPGFINNLASARSTGMTSGQAAHFKSAPMRKFLTSLTGDKLPHVDTMATTEEAAAEFGIQPVSHVVASTIPPMKFIELEGADLRYVREPQVQQSGDRIAVTGGDFFLTAHRPLTVELPFGTMTLKKYTTVNVHCSPQGGRVINVFDQYRDSVSLRICQKTVALMPGKECTFSLSKEFVVTKRHDGCGRRAFKDDACCKYSFRTDEVSIAALLKHHPIGHQLYRSANESDLKLKNQMLKTAASLAFWTKSKTPYTWD